MYICKRQTSFKTDDKSAFLESGVFSPLNKMQPTVVIW